VKHVLVTTDFSTLADAALGFAAELAKRYGAKLTIAHVIPGDRPPEPDPQAPYFKVAKRVWDANLEVEKAARAELEKRASGVAVAADLAIARCAPVPGLLDVVKQVGADLVVISSAGRTGLSRIVLGSVAEELARNSPIPVLIWKSQPKT
jgi:nucleotide-binding universal stress UspA family protein